MEIRELAERILLADSLERKLERIPPELTDDQPGTSLRVTVPGRPRTLCFAAHRMAPAMPRPGALRDPHKRAIAHHILANHELQALEVMAVVLLAFPEAPTPFRSGLVRIMEDEQRHTRMHADRAAELGVQFGDLPVNNYIWAKAQMFESVLDYLAGLSLTFEGRNLDHTLEFAEHFTKVADDRSAALFRVIHRDEIGHVRFGMEWLRRLKSPDQTEWDAYVSHLHWPLRAEKSVGNVFQREARLQAGLSQDFVDRLAGAQADASRAQQPNRE